MYIRFSWIGLLTASLILSGCHSFRYMDKANIKLPEHWNSTVIAGDTFAGHQNFWEAFDDAKLNQLISEVLSVNNDVELATLNLKKFQAYTNSEILQGILPSAETTIAAKTQPFRNHQSVFFDHNISLKYEIDLLGKKRASRSMNTLELEAIKEDRQVVALNLIVNTATIYWKIGLLKQAIAINEDATKKAQKILDLTVKQFEAGNIPKSEVLSAEKDLTNVQLKFEQQKDNLVKSRHSMAALFNRSPEQHIDIECDSLTLIKPPEVLINLPTKIIEHRSDIKAAKNRLYKAIIDSRNNGILSNPVLSISGTLETIIGALSNPVGVAATLQSMIKINWDGISKIKNIECEEALVKYRETVYEALLEIENLLVAHESLQKKSQQLLKLHTATLESMRIARTRYQAGAIDLKTYLSKVSERFSVELDVIDNKFNQLINTMTLYQALGGQFHSEMLNPKEKNTSLKKEASF